MSEDTFKVVLIVVIIGALIALLVITADVMMQHPSIPWFICGAVALAVVEGIAYLVYLLVKYIREQRSQHTQE